MYVSGKLFILIQTKTRESSSWIRAAVYTHVGMSLSNYSINHDDDRVAYKAKPYDE